MTCSQSSFRPIALHHCQSLVPLPIVTCVLLALVVLAGCSTTTDTEQPERPDAVHQAWITAIRAGNTDAALTLVDPDLPEQDQFAREAVARMREYLTSPASPTGALEGITVEPVSDSVGRSVWQFTQKRWCYRAELIDRGGRWYVSRWGQTSVDCR
jgi:hypothetical protein